MPMTDGIMNPLITAYELGYRAGVDGEDPRLCPYPKMTTEAQAWQEALRHGANVRSNAISFAFHYEADELYRQRRALEQEVREK